MSEAKDLNKGAAQEILARFHRDVQERFRVWPLDNEIVAMAVSLIQEHNLRSIDAIHLATAVTIFSIVPETQSLLVSSDRELVEAAQARDLLALDPTDANALARRAEVRRSER